MPHPPQEFYNQMGKMTAESGGNSVKKFNRVKGIRGENLAVKYLKKQGYKIVARNWRNPFWHLGVTDEKLLKDLIERHARFTGSKLAAELLAHWSNARARFVKVMPLQYKEALLAGAGR